MGLVSDDDVLGFRMTIGAALDDDVFGEGSNDKSVGCF